MHTCFSLIKKTPDYGALVAKYERGTGACLAVVLSVVRGGPDDFQELDLKAERRTRRLHGFHALEHRGVPAAERRFRHFHCKIKDNSHAQTSAYT